MQRTARLQREVRMLDTEPPPGISCCPHGDDQFELRAPSVVSALLCRYPFEPPKLRFLTPIYHPNIDTAGRICLDILKMPPKGAWRPALNISTVLSSIQLLMAEPNPDDPLMTEISAEYKYNREVFFDKARMLTKKHAVDEIKVRTVHL
uniref:Ubiquitin-conjugating enzyme E2T (putative) n=1 Tax=Eptatretus burgeri TaxID=7764 RepID=A0A8C4QW57_EPTBU